MATLQQALQGIDPKLADVLLAIALGVSDIAASLRAAPAGEAGTSNALGDRQLLADVAADGAMLAALRGCAAVQGASSEEQPHDIPLPGQGYSVAYDPLDGSSVMPANWAVGAIFGVWPGAGFLGRRGREQAAAGYAVFGPKTLLVLARPLAAADSSASAAAGGGRGSGMTVQEFELAAGGWALARDGVTLAHTKKLFAPANLRAAAGNAAYGQLVAAWMEEQYTLRYSGAMVPDVHMLLTKGGGVFANPVSPAAPPKLRSLYECLPLALVAEAAGGAAVDSEGEVLDGVLSSHDQRRGIALGSAGEVARCRAAMGLP